MPPHTTWVAIW